MDGVAGRDSSHLDTAAARARVVANLLGER
jgi:hypothetical protein